MKKVQTQKKVYLYLLKNPKASLRKIDKALDINTAGYHAAMLRKEGKLPAAPFGKVGKHKRKSKKVWEPKKDDFPVFTMPIAPSSTNTIFMSCVGKNAVDMATRPQEVTLSVDQLPSQNHPKHLIDIPTKSPEKEKLPLLCRLGLHKWECYELTQLTWNKEGQGRMCQKCRLQEERYRRAPNV